MKILICGGRDFSNWHLFVKTLTAFIFDNDVKKSELTIISGMARGADTMALDFARMYNINYEEYPADWDRYGNSAGPIRNQQMIDEGKPNLVIAFPGGHGTADMVRRSKKHNIKVIEIEL